MNTIIPFYPFKKAISWLAKFYFSKSQWGGAAMLLCLLLFIKPLSGQQCPLDAIKFEIVSIPPATPWRALSTSAAPGAFHAYYQVNLKAVTGNLPTTLQIQHLAFNGKILLNNFTSRIDQTLTEEFLPIPPGGPVGGILTPLGQFLNLDDLAVGEINWEIGTESSCIGGEPPTQINLPANTASVRLFTIVVEAVPGDLIRWLNYSAFLDNCPGCMGNLLVTTPGNSTNINFPQPAISNNPLKLKFVYDYDFGLLSNTIKVFLDTPLNGFGFSSFGKVDGVIHIVPEMLGSSDINLSTGYYQDGPALIHREVRSNNDGSFDIYFSFENFPDPDNPNAPALTNPQALFPIYIDGLYNISQGGTLHCSLLTPTGRWTIGPLASNPQTYRLNSVPADINIPGSELCDQSITITGDTYQSLQDCSAGIRFVFKHDSPQPVLLSHLAFELFYRPSSFDGVTPGAITSTVPFSQTSGSLVTLPNMGYKYEYLYSDANNPISLTSGAYIELPFQIENGCIPYFVLLGETIPANEDLCALDVALGAPLCDPKVRGHVLTENAAHVPDYRVRLESIPNSNYEIELNEDCEEAFAFCPDPAEAPFRLRILKQATSSILCGVTTYDCVLISKDILGIQQTLDSPYKVIAANAFRGVPNPPDNPQAVKTSDVTNIRLCILGVKPDFGGNNGISAPSWWYIRETLNLAPDPLPNSNYETANTFDVPINGIDDFGGFIAVKVGDINLTCAEYCDGQRPDSEAQKTQQPFFSVESSQVRQEGNMLFVPVFADAPFDLLAAQAGFRFDPSLLRLKNVIPNPELPIGETHFGRTEEENGALRFAWHPYDGETTLPKKALLFTLQFELKPGMERPNEALLWASDHILESLVYSENGTEYAVNVHWKDGRSNQTSALGVVVNPNPFQENITAFIYSEKHGKAMVRLADSRGFSYITQKVQLIEGDNAVELQANYAAQPGIYFLSVEFEGQKIQRRVVKL